MKKYIKKIFIAFAVVISFISISLSNINAQDNVNSPIDEFVVPNILENCDVFINQVGSVYDIIISKNYSSNYVEGIPIDLYYKYIIDFNGLQSVINGLQVGIEIDGNIVELLPYNITSDNQQFLYLPLISNGTMFEQVPGSYFNIVFLSQVSFPVTDNDIKDNIKIYNYDLQLLETSINNKSLNPLFEFIIAPFNDLLDLIGINDDIIFSPGFGNVTWFSIPLKQSISFIFAIIVFLWFIKFMLKLLKRFFGFIFGGFWL